MSRGNAEPAAPTGSVGRDAEADDGAACLDPDAELVEQGPIPAVTGRRLADHDDAAATHDANGGSQRDVRWPEAPRHGTVERGPAAVGAHTEEVLREAGFEASEIESFRSDGVF